jgi:hypothetical protein
VTVDERRCRIRFAARVDTHCHAAGFGHHGVLDDPHALHVSVFGGLPAALVERFAHKLNRVQRKVGPRRRNCAQGGIQPLKAIQAIQFRHRLPLSSAIDASGTHSAGA